MKATGRHLEEAERRRLGARHPAVLHGSRRAAVPRGHDREAEALHPGRRLHDPGARVRRLPPAHPRHPPPGAQRPLLDRGGSSYGYL